jgi:hypothetical protein
MGRTLNAAALIERVIQARIEGLQQSFDQACGNRQAKLLREQPVKKKGLKPQILDQETKIRTQVLAALSGMASGNGRLPRAMNALDLTALTILKDQIVPALVRAIPSITRSDLEKLLRECWPSARGRRAGDRPMFAPELVEQAHAALIREHADWGCKGACQTLAERLFTDARTIKNLLQVSRQRKNR